MISLPTKSKIIQLEQKIGVKFPTEYKFFLEENDVFPFSNYYSENAFFIHDLKSLNNSKKSVKYHYSQFLTFFVDIDNTDYYGFLPTSKIRVFSQQDFVGEWHDFEDWINWNRNLMQPKSP